MRGILDGTELLPGLAVAVVLHSLYNQFIVAPLLATAYLGLVPSGLDPGLPADTAWER